MLATQQYRTYKRHRPETTLLYKLVERYSPDFIENLANQGKYLPKYVKRRQAENVGVWLDNALYYNGFADDVSPFFGVTTGKVKGDFPSFLNDTSRWATAYKAYGESGSSFRKIRAFPWRSARARLLTNTERRLLDFLVSPPHQLKGYISYPGKQPDRAFKAAIRQNVLMTLATPFMLGVALCAGG